MMKQTEGHLHEPSHGVPGGQPIEVLIVEDSPTQTERLRYFLEENSFKVIAAADGHEAMEYIVRRQPNLVLTDVLMPGMDGHELCRRIKSDDSLKHIPVILMTSLSDPANVVKGLEAGADNFVAKPYDEAELLARVQHILLNRAQDEEAEAGVEIVFAGTRYYITSPRLQILNLLLSSFETAVHKNQELERLREELQNLNDSLEQKVGTRTAALRNEIAERERAEQELRQSETRYRSLVESSPNANCVHVEGRIVYINSSGIQLLGAERSEDLAGRDLLDFVHPEHRADIAHRMAMVTEHKRVATLTEAKLLRLDGSEIDVDIVTIPFTFEGRSAANSIIRDISDRKRAERALRESEDQLRQSQKMEAVGRLAGGVAHDFNNLLTAIVGYTDLTEADLGLDSPHLDNLREIHSAADRATALTRQLLAFSRRQALQPRVLDLNEVTGSMAGLLGRIIGEDISLVFMHAANLWAVEADPGQIEQVIMNLAVNARDAMPHGGSLTIETANVDLDVDYAAFHPESQPGPHAVLTVSDTGCGIPKELVPHIFEPFFTTKDVGKGTGLGLSTVS
jgi:two-component system cell cycle sensor histidine kinase/response regulator CckA